MFYVLVKNSQTYFSIRIDRQRNTEGYSVNILIVCFYIIQQMR